jgi:hypothetical protein
MKKVLFAALAGLSVMFMASSSGSKNFKNSQMGQVVSGKYTGDSTTPKPDSPKYAMNTILSDTTKDTTSVPKFVAMMHSSFSDTTKDSTKVPKFVAMVQRMISDTTKDSTKTGPKYYAIIEKLMSDTTKDSTKLPKYDMAYNDRN